MHRLLAAAFCFSAIPCLAQERAPVEPKSLPAPDQEMEPVKPAIERLEDGRMQVGKVTFDPKTREIRFPAAVNMTDGLLEFVIVHESGKVHESLFITDISATHLNLAFKLLRYIPSPELYMLPNGTGGLSGEFPEVDDKVKAGSRIKMDIEWKDGDRVRKVPLNEWIQHAVKGDTMPAGPWVYGGSEVLNGKFVPEITGDIAAIFVTNASLINYPGEDNQDDTVWLVYPKRVPAEGTRVSIIVSPYQSDQPVAKP